MDESAKTEESDEEPTYYESANEVIAQLWYQHGLFCASHPKLIIFFSIIVVLTCSAPLFDSSGFNIPASMESTTTTTLQSENETLPHWFDGKPFVYVIQFVLTTKISTSLSSIQSRESIRQALEPAFRVTNVISTFKDMDSGQGSSDLCLKVTSGVLMGQRSGLRVQDNKFLPASGCLLLSPSNLWNQDFDRFSNDEDVFDDMYQTYGRPAFNILLKEFIFGTSLKHTGLYPKLQGVGPDNSVQYAVTLVMTSYRQSYVDALKKKLQTMYPVPEDTRERDSNDNEIDDTVLHIFYKDDGGTLVELGPISVAYFVVFLYLAFSVAKIDMVKSKWGLAFSAVITVVASLVMAGGLSTFFGLVPTLHSSEVIPYLVIMVGVENTLVITKSVVSTPVDLDVKVRVATGLSKEGKYMMKNLATEMLVIGLGYFTNVPAIQEFCLFAFIGLLSDFFLQVFLFSTILSIDIRRMEISDLNRVSIQQQVMLANRKNTRPPNTTPHLLPPLSEESIRNPTQQPVIPVRSKRLKLVNFWARTRMVQRACMICAVLYFIYIVFYSVTPSTFHNLTSSHISDQNIDDEMSLSKIIGKIVAEHDTESIKNTPDHGNIKKESKEMKTKSKDILTSSKDSWNGLSNFHWPQLLSYYNTSLLGRYISILPPIHLGFKIDITISTPTEESNSQLKTPKPFLESTLQDPDPRDMSINSRDPEYYFNALSCVVLGVIVMIVLFFVCKYLNDLQIRPKSRRSFREMEFKYEDLVEAIPLSLKGHPQNVEHMKCTSSNIVSICLSGQIRVWNRTTGECIGVIRRRGEIPKSRPRCGSRKKPRPVRTYARSKYFKNLERTNGYGDNSSMINVSSPDILSDSDSNNALINTSGELSEQLNPNINEQDGKSRTVSVSSCRSDNSGYDFGPCCQVGSPKISSFGSAHSLDNSWSSEEDDCDPMFSESDESGVQVKSETPNEGVCRTAAVWCLDCKDDVLATGCSDGVAELWSLSSGRQICLYSDNRSGITSIAFLPDSPVLVVARIDGTLDFLTLLDPVIPTRSNISPFKRSSPKSQRKTTTDHPVDVSPMQAHALPLCSLTHRVRAHHQPASVMVVTKERVVTGSRDRTLKVFRTHDAARIFTLHGHRDGITALNVLQNDPNFVISGASNGGVRVWDITTGECLQHLRGHTCAVIALACTKEHIISTSIDNSMCIWDRQKGKCIHYNLKQFPDFCSNIVMMYSNLFTTGGQGCIALWDLHSGKQIKTIPLDNGDSSVIVRNINVCDSASIVCSYGKELRIVMFPFVMNKVE